MKLIFSEIIIGWKRDFRLILLLLGLSIVGIFCVGTACRLLTETGRQTAAYREVYEDNQFYTVEDNFLSNAPAEMETVENTLKFRKFMDLMMKSEYFEYFMMSSQPVYIENYRGKFNNVNLYEHRSGISDATQDIQCKDGTVRASTKVNAFWIGDNVIDSFGLRLSDGRAFAEDDFILKPDGPVSVLLGANYAEDYAVGDELYISFVFAERPAQVVGFLKEGSNVYHRGKFLNLDTYVIMPLFINDTYDDEEIYNFNVNYLYTLRNRGTIATKLSMQDIKKILDIYSEEAGFEYQHAYYVLESNTTEKVNFDYGIKMVSFLVSAIAAAAIVTACLFIGICTASRMKKNQRYYAVLALNGCRKGQICSLLLLDAAIIFLTAGLLAGAVFAVVFGTEALVGRGALLGLLLGTAFFIAFPWVITLFLFCRRDLIFYLKEETGDADSGQRDETV